MDKKTIHMKIYSSGSHYLERSSASDFKDAADPRFGHNDVHSL